MPKADDFDTFYAATSRRLIGQIFAMTGDLSEAEDAVQEAYIRAWRRWPRIRAHDDPEAWLRVVAYRITVNSWRRARNRLTAHRASQHPEMPGLSPDLVVLVSALRKIPETQRRAIVLHHLVGLSVEEIARGRCANRERNTLMPETFSTQLAGLAGYAARNASLDPAAALRGRATRRTLRRRGGAAALLGGSALAVAISLGVTNAGVVMPAHSTASSSPGSVQLTAYQTTVLAKAHVTKANVAVLKKMHLTPVQIQALGAAYGTARQIGGAEGTYDKQLTVAQIEAIAKADLTAAQLAALGG
jgi:RNA polymerase sigma-70 factor (ECF subfamily)